MGVALRLKRRFIKMNLFFLAGLPSTGLASVAVPWGMDSFMVGGLVTDSIAYVYLFILHLRNKKRSSPLTVHGA